MTCADFWQRLALAGLIIVCIWTLLCPGMIFGKLGKWLEKLLPEWAQKPLFECPPCMASLWGTMVFLLTGGGTVVQGVVFVLALCGLMRILSGIALK